MFQVQVEWVGEPGRVEGKRKFFSKVLINKQHEVSLAVIDGPFPAVTPVGLKWVLCRCLGVHRRHGVCLSGCS